MTTNTAQEPSTSADRRRSPLAELGLWLIPVAVVAAVMSMLAAAYLGGTLNSSDHIADFPIAIVNADEGATQPDGTPLTAGDDIEEALLDSIDPEQFDVQSLTLAEAEEQMNEGTLYGAIVIPETLSADLLAWTTGALAPGDVTQPSVTILTNPRVGAAATSIMTNLGQTALDQANAQIGEQQTMLAAQYGQQSGAAAPAGTAAAALEQPMSIEVEAYRPLPDGTGGGLSAFYYALLLLLAGFTGSIAASTLIDSRLGFLPTEFGPLYRLSKNSGVSRSATLLVKWGVGALVAISVSGLYVAISAALGMPIDNPWLLWAFGAAMIFAVSVVCQTINALAGNAGMLINLLLFVILGLPSAGGALPVEATPPFLRWLANFEPLHQIYLGARSVLYFDATWTSGLGRALIAAGIATVAGLLIGLLGTKIYDRSRFARSPEATEVRSSAR